MAELIDKDATCGHCFCEADFYYIPWRKYLCDDCALETLKVTLDLKIMEED